MPTSHLAQFLFTLISTLIHRDPLSVVFPPVCPSHFVPVYRWNRFSLEHPCAYHWSCVFWVFFLNFLVLYFLQLFYTSCCYLFKSHLTPVTWSGLSFTPKLVHVDSQFSNRTIEFLQLARFQLIRNSLLPQPHWQGFDSVCIF